MESHELTELIRVRDYLARAAVNARHICTAADASLDAGDEQDARRHLNGACGDLMGAIEVARDDLNRLIEDQRPPPSEVSRAEIRDTLGQGAA